MVVIIMVRWLIKCLDRNGVETVLLIMYELLCYGILAVKSE